SAIVCRTRRSHPAMPRSSGGELSPCKLTRILPHPAGEGAAPLNATQHRVRSDSVVWTARLPSALLLTCQALTWRRGATVLTLCLILSTQVLAQPDLFEHWSLDRIVEGWSYYFVELGLTGFAMLGGFALAESIAEGNGRRRAIAVGAALPASAALGYAL